MTGFKSEFRPGDKVRIIMPKGISAAKHIEHIAKRMKKRIGRVVTIKRVLQTAIYPFYNFVECSGILSGIWLVKA